MREKQRHSNTSILSTIRKKQVFSIVQHLRPQQVVKKVRFDEKVTCLKLVSPSEIYHCLYPKHIPLKDSFDPPIRKLENNVWCVCNRCRMLLTGCGKESACDMCFGSGRVQVLSRTNHYVNISLLSSIEELTLLSSAQP